MSPLGGGCCISQGWPFAAAWVQTATPFLGRWFFRSRDERTASSLKRLSPAAGRKKEDQKIREGGLGDSPFQRDAPGEGFAVFKTSKPTTRQRRDRVKQSQDGKSACQSLQDVQESKQHSPSVGGEDLSTAPVSEGGPGSVCSRRGGAPRSGSGPAEAGESADDPVARAEPDPGMSVGGPGPPT